MISNSNNTLENEVISTNLTRDDVAQIEDILANYKARIEEIKQELNETKSPRLEAYADGINLVFPNGFTLNIRKVDYMNAGLMSIMDKTNLDRLVREQDLNNLELDYEKIADIVYKKLSKDWKELVGLTERL